eukprot:6180044-Pleurochrysis_carterae.AAC.1
MDAEKASYVVDCVCTLGSSSADVMAQIKACKVLTEIFNSACGASYQQHAADNGLFDALVPLITQLPSSLQQQAENCSMSRLVASACRTLERACTGKGAARRRDQAVDAGAIPLLVRMVREKDVHDEAVSASSLAALRSITRDSLRIQEAALAAGASLASLR